MQDRKYFLKIELTQNRNPCSQQWVRMCMPFCLFIYACIRSCTYECEKEEIPKTYQDAINIGLTNK